MHACLYVDEILRLIIRELVVPGAKGTAVAVACCCKSFEDPVLDTLWETQTQLLYLLETLPGVFLRGGAGWAVSVPMTYTLISTQLFDLKAFQRMFDDPRTRSFPKIRSKDAETPRQEHPHHSLGSTLSCAAIRRK